jgi:hypothetical protein
MSRYARKKDTTHNRIFDAARAVGATVKETYQFPGMLDAIVAFRGRIYWGDAKTGNAELTPAEEQLILDFARVGVRLYVWRTADELLRDIGAID